MFTDMVGSTEMTQKLGDAMAVELVRAHDAIIRRSLDEYDGHEVKHLGDGIMASFDLVPNSVMSAMASQRVLVTYNKNSDTSIHVRIDIHAGEPVEEGGDLIGSAVQMAARICAAGQAGAILVSDEVKHACLDTDLQFEPIGSETLKGFSDPVELFLPVTR